jgi:hypothetical protein
MSHQLWTTLIKYNVSPNQLYFLDCCRYKIKPTHLIDEDKEREVATERGHLDKDGKLTPGALFVLDEFETLLSKTKKKVVSEVLGMDALKNVKIYREMFPAEKLPSGEVGRQGIQELRDKFVWFFKTYPEFTWDNVLDATDYYIHTKRKDGFNYMINSTYFIQKTDPRTKVSRSALADHCQLLIDNPEIFRTA